MSCLIYCRSGTASWKKPKKLWLESLRRSYIPPFLVPMVILTSVISKSSSLFNVACWSSSCWLSLTVPSLMAKSCITFSASFSNGKSGCPGGVCSISLWRIHQYYWINIMLMPSPNWIYTYMYFLNHYSLLSQCLWVNNLFLTDMIASLHIVFPCKLLHWFVRSKPTKSWNNNTPINNNDPGKI